MIQTLPHEIKKQIKAYQEAINILNTGYTTLYMDDPYEWLVVAQTEELNKKLKESKQCTSVFIQKMKANEGFAAAILKLMPGKCAYDKKKELIKLLQDNPALATTDEALLYQRISLFYQVHDKMNCIPLPETPIRDTLQQRHEEDQNNEFLE